MDQSRVWHEFLSALEQGPLPADRLRPYQPALLEPLTSVLNHLRPHLCAAQDPLTRPECFAYGPLVQFILPLGPGMLDFCFSFLLENEHWYLQHIENVFIRLDEVSELPASTFPDLPEPTKAWCREEWQVTEMVRLYAFLRAEKGKDFALDWFRDGDRYVLGARAWVPYVPVPKAFILYLCWDWANLQDNPVTLLQLDEHQAVVRASLRCFKLYQRSAHLAQQITLPDYIELFATIWQDRAACAGWQLRISAELDPAVFTFER